MSVLDTALEQWLSHRRRAINVVNEQLEKGPNALGGAPSGTAFQKRRRAAHSAGPGKGLVERAVHEVGLTT